MARSVWRLVRASGIGAGIILILLATGAPYDAGGQEVKTLALMPFENVSGSVDSVRIVMPIVEQNVREKGYQIISPDQIESFLSRHRIRNTGMLSRAQLLNLRREFNVDLALIGSVELFYESAENPQWGLSSRLVSTSQGSILWAESTGRTGGDYTGMLGLGTITSGRELAHKVVRLLYHDLPAPGSSLAASQHQKSASSKFFTMGRRYCGAMVDVILHLFHSNGGYRSPALHAGRTWRVAVTIFENASERRGAGRILADVFTTALFRHGRFDVIDPGEANEALLALGHTSYGGIDIATLREFKKRTGIDALFRGTVYRYNEGLKREATTLPDIALDATMLDTETGKILWFAVEERSGDDCQIALDFGVVSSIVPLIRKAVAEMLETL
jgi:TolB-like protein